MDRDSESPITSESQTATLTNACGGNVDWMVGMAGVGGMPGMLPGMGMGMSDEDGGNPGIYGMYPWMGGMPGMGGMLPGMARMSGGVDGMLPGMTGMSGMMPGMAGMSGMGMGMSGMPAAAGGSRMGMSGIWDNVHRLCLDHLTGGSEDYTPPETQYTGVETFSLEELGLSPMRELTPQPTKREPVASQQGQGSGSVGRSKKKGKGKGVAAESSQAGGKMLRPKEECTALTKAWISVVDDPIRSNNQASDGIQARIVASYEVFKPAKAK